MAQNNTALAIELLQNNFGSNWLGVAQTIGLDNLCRRVGKDLTSFMAFPDRGQGGSNQWRGNCSPRVVYKLLKYVLESKTYDRKPVDKFLMLDPMSGSGSSKAAADYLKVDSVLYDLNPSPNFGIGNWNALKDDVMHSSDFCFFHPPYHNIVTYSGKMWGKAHEDDLSRCENYNDFIEKLNFVIKKLFLSLRKDGRLAILVGDIRKNGKFHSIQQDMMKIGKLEAFITKGQFNCVSDNSTYSKPFITVVTEYIVLLHKNDIMMIPFTNTMSGVFNPEKEDSKALTWKDLIRLTMEKMGGKAELGQLYSMLKNHPKAANKTHYEERIRATIYENKSEFVQVNKGCYRLCYQTA